jgi:hypothetical protein
VADDVEGSVKSLDELIEVILQTKKDWFHALPPGIGTPIKVEFAGKSTVLYVHAVRRPTQGTAEEFSLLLKAASVDPPPAREKEVYDPTQN